MKFAIESLPTLCCPSFNWMISPRKGTAWLTMYTLILWNDGLRKSSHSRCDSCSRINRLNSTNWTVPKLKAGCLSYLIYTFYEMATFQHTDCDTSALLLCGSCQYYSIKHDVFICRLIGPCFAQTNPKNKDAIPSNRSPSKRTAEPRLKSSFRARWFTFRIATYQRNMLAQALCVLLRVGVREDDWMCDVYAALCFCSRSSSILPLRQASLLQINFVIDTALFSWPLFPMRSQCIYMNTSSYSATHPKALSFERTQHLLN